jgi:exodeoxyribonuclease VII small subunit
MMAWYTPPWSGKNTFKTEKRSIDMAEKKNKGHSFESALERLELIVAEMENGQLGLDEMTVRFEEGTRLTKFCEQKLNEVERKISVLMEKEEGLAEEPFEAVADADSGNGSML